MLSILSPIKKKIGLTHPWKKRKEGENREHGNTLTGWFPNPLSNRFENILFIRQKRRGKRENAWGRGGKGRDGKKNKDSEKARLD